jgi:gliding motility-associated-like protein
VFNTTTCSWDNTGSQPVQPAIVDCWDVFVFNTTTCSWDNTGSQPAQPAVVDCWDVFVFNTTTCSWDNTGSQPAQPPVVDCWDTFVFNTTTCSWENTGIAPLPNETNVNICQGDSYTWAVNNVTYTTEQIGLSIPGVGCTGAEVLNLTITNQPVQPILACYETATFDAPSCSWVVSGSQPAQPPVVDCWDNFVFNTSTCTWYNTGTPPLPNETHVNICQGASYMWPANNVTYTTEQLGLTIPGIGCTGDEILNLTITNQPVQPTIACYETATFNTSICSWEVTGTQPDQPAVDNCWDNFVFNTTTCVWDNTGTKPIQPIIESVISDGSDIVISTKDPGDVLYAISGDDFQSSNIFYNVIGGLYTITVKEVYCDTLTRIEYLHFVIPKFFTPNNDGLNDQFNLTGIENYNASEVSIFDRYGKLLKNSRNAPFSWDGTFNGQLLASSDYWYVIIINNQKFTGHVALKR